MFDDFQIATIETADASIFVRYAGEGPAVYVLHGHPRTSATWHRVAPKLVDAGFAAVWPRASERPTSPLL